MNFRDHPWPSVANRKGSTTEIYGNEHVQYAAIWSACIRPVIECANINGAVASDSFKKWALANGAVEIGELAEPESNWITIRDQCLKDLEGVKI